MATFNQDTAPFAMNFNLDMKKVMKTKATTHQFAKWCQINEMERLLRAKQHRLFKLLVDCKVECLIAPILHKIKGLNRVKNGDWTRKQRWVDEIIFADDKDVKDMFSEEAIRQLCGVIKNRVQEGKSIIRVCDKALFLSETDPTEFKLYMDIFTQFLKQEGLNDLAGNGDVGFCATIDEDNVDPSENRHRFMSEAALRHTLGDSRVNKTNPIYGTPIEEEINKRMLGIYLDPCDFHFDGI